MERQVPIVPVSQYWRYVEECEKSGPSYVFWGKAKWCGLCGKQSGDIRYNEKAYIL